MQAPLESCQQQRGSGPSRRRKKTRTSEPAQDVTVVAKELKNPELNGDGGPVSLRYYDRRNPPEPQASLESSEIVCSIPSPALEQDITTRIRANPASPTRITPLTLESLRIHDDGVAGRNDTGSEHPFSDHNERQSRVKARSELESDYREVDKMRNQILGLRLEVQQGRRRLKNARRIIQDYDAVLLQKLRLVCAGMCIQKSGLQAFNFNEPQSLISDFEIVQEHRDQYQPAEDDHEALENQLQYKEWELQNLEAKLYQRSRSRQISLLDDEDGTILANEHEYTESSSNPDSVIQRPPQESEYSLLLDDIALLEDNLAELRAEHAQLKKDELLRAQLGLLLDEESRDALERFPEKEIALDERLTSAIEILSRKGDAIFVSRHLPLSQFDQDDVHNMSPPWFSTTEQTTDPLLLLGDVDDKPLPIFTFSEDIKAKTTINKQTFTFSEAIKAKTAVNKQTFINQWLLHKMRTSRFEIQRFKCASQFDGSFLSPENLKDLVLEMWPKDSGSIAPSLTQNAGSKASRISALTTGSKHVDPRTTSHSFPAPTERLHTHTGSEY